MTQNRVRTVNLRRYVLRRILLIIPVLLGISLMTFTISQVIPSDPAQLALGGHARRDQIEAMREKLGFYEPVYVQYWIYLKNLLRGDLGYSWMNKRPVLDNVRTFFPATFELTLLAMFFTVILGTGLGVLSATHRDKPLDHVSRFWALSGVSIPIFWLGLMVQLIFYLRLGWIPYGRRLDAGISPPSHITGMYTLDSLLTGNFRVFANALQHIIAPALVLSYASMAVLTRMTRASLLDAFTQDYMKTARAKGLSERTVIYKHALKNALLPTFTVAGLQYGYMLGGSFLIETVFSWPGMGRFAVNSIIKLDFQGVMGVTIVIALMFLIVNLIVDILYALVDPRIRYG